MMNPKMTMMVMAILMLAALFFTVQGVQMHNAVDAKEERLHSLQNDYFSLAKSERDSAAANSELNKTLVEIKQAPSDLLRLKLVGVGKILTGIFILLFGILMALMMMPIKLGQVIKAQT